MICPYAVVLYVVQMYVIYVKYVRESLTMRNIPNPPAAKMTSATATLTLVHRFFLGLNFGSSK